MVTQDYINNNETETLKKGDKVIMHNCVEAEFYKATQWVCQTNSFNDRGGQDVVFLENFSGYFIAKYLKKI